MPINALAWDLELYITGDKIKREQKMKTTLINSIENHASMVFMLFAIITAVLTYISITAR